MKNHDIARTDSDIIAAPALPLILFGVLKGYLHHPLRFLCASLLTFPRFRKTVRLDLPKEFLDSNALIAWLYIRLRKRTEPRRAFEIIRAAVLTSGLALQQAGFRNVEAERTMENLILFQQRTNREGSTRLNTMLVEEEGPERYKFRVSRCVFFELFTRLGVPELTTIFCSIDNAIFNSYLPDQLFFHRENAKNTRPQGARECVFVIERRPAPETGKEQRKRIS